MRTSLRLTTGAAVLGVASLVGAPAALAQTVTCDAYSEGCDTTEVLPDTEDREDDEATRGTDTTGVAGGSGNRSSGTPSSLPFTGGETMALSLAGASALAAGTALVVAGRRRAAASA